MPASIEGAAPANTGFCALEPGTKTKKTNKNSHFRNTFIPREEKTSLPPYQTPRAIVILSVDWAWAGWNRQELRAKCAQISAYGKIRATEKKLLEAGRVFCLRKRTSLVAMSFALNEDHERSNTCFDSMPPARPLTLKPSTAISPYRFTSMRASLC